jgi:hypothetical protein
MSSNIASSRNKSKIEKIFLELPNYTYCHSANNEISSSFLGRETLLDKIKAIITSSHSGKGIYLITGNRGVGKSSFMDKVIEDASLSSGHAVRRPFFALVLTIFSVLTMSYLTGKYNAESLWWNKCLWIIILLLRPKCFLLLGGSNFGQKEHAARYNVYDRIP